MSRVALMLCASIMAGTACPLGRASQPAQEATISELRSTLAEPLALLESASSLRGRFVQTKQLAGFDLPLISEGDFLYLRDHGLIWRTHTPIQSELLLNDDGVHGLALLDADQTDGNAAATRPLAQIFLALFSLDLHALTQHFKVSSVEVDTGWLLHLQPRDTAMAQIANDIRVSGGAQIQQVSFSDALSDQTRISFSEMTVGDAPPTQIELDRFAH